MEDSKQIIQSEIDKLILSTIESLNEVKTFTIGEVWRILQLLIATVIRLIENIGTDLSSPEKKSLAMSLITEFYDKVFTSIDIPMIPSLIESMLHGYVKQIILILVDSAIDSMVKTFREVGIFVQKQKPFAASVTVSSPLTNSFVKNLKQ